jgi:hypothetical protein
MLTLKPSKLPDHVRPGTLLDGDIVCDHALPMFGDDCEYRIDHGALLADDEALVPMDVMFPQLNRLRRRIM